MGFKTSQIPREYEHDLRKALIEKLQRGNIDLFISVDQEQNVLENSFNAGLVKKLFVELKSIFNEMDQDVSTTELAAALLRIPEVREVQKRELVPEEWQLLLDTIFVAADNLDAFRIQEGELLGKDMLTHLDAIEEYLREVERLDPTRIVSIRKRLEDKMAGMCEEITLDQNRLEQELIYYLEKMDINEERVRLKQHCVYFVNHGIEVFVPEFYFPRNGQQNQYVGFQVGPCPNNNLL